MAKGLGTGNISSDIKEAIENLTLVDISTDVDNNDEFLVYDISTGELKKILSENIVGGGTIDANPVGLPALWFTDTAPSDHVMLQNQDLSRVAYPELFALWGTTFGVGDGSTTFGTPKVEDRFIRILGSGGGVDAASRTDRGDGTTGDNVGTLQEDAIRNITGSWKIRGLSNSSSNIYLDRAGALNYNSNNHPATSGISFGANSASSELLFNASGSVPTAADNRPKNIYARMIVRYQKSVLASEVLAETINSTNGAVDANKVVRTDVNGRIDESFSTVYRRQLKPLPSTITNTPSGAIPAIGFNNLVIGKSYRIRAQVLIVWTALASGTMTFIATHDGAAKARVAFGHNQSTNSATNNTHTHRSF